MRTTLLTSAALLVVVVTAPALSQPTVTPPTAPGSSVTAKRENSERHGRAPGLVEASSAPGGPKALARRTAFGDSFC